MEPEEDIKLTNFQRMIALFVLGLLIGLFVPITYYTTKEHNTAIAVADRIEEVFLKDSTLNGFLHNYGQSFQIDGDMTLNQFREMYLRYHSPARGLLESQITEYCFR